MVTIRFWLKDNSALEDLLKMPVYYKYYICYSGCAKPYRNYIGRVIINTNSGNTNYEDKIMQDLFPICEMAEILIGNKFYSINTLFKGEI